VLAVTAGAVALVLTGGGVAVAQAHKTVTLDVDGEVATISTFDGSVEGLLADRGVVVGARDAVSPTGALTEGAQVVVRHAHQVTVSRGGAQQTVWTTALTAAEALADLTVRDSAVTLVASRSGDRAQMPLDLTAGGPAQIVVDGQTLTVPDGTTDVDGALAARNVTLQPLDTVTVRRADEGVQVVVQRVVVQDVTTTSEVPFAQQTVQDGALYKGTTKVRTAGVAGVRTVVDRVTTVDGVETARETLSDEVTTAPVDEVVAVGTKAKPKPKPAAPAAGSSSAPAAVSGDVDSLNWAALAACESGGRADAVSRNGKYYGLYQFSVGTWQGVGGSGLPSQASADEQTARAKALYARSGAGQWPVCGKRLFS
jgi:uncharacterized protein YabE (DUF348 family)